MLEHPHFTIPAEFEADVRRLAQLTEDAHRLPELYRERLTLLEDLAHRPGLEQDTAFSVGVLVDLAEAYRTSTIGDHAANLSRAIACCRRGLSLVTSESAPLEYAHVLHCLGNAYGEMGELPGGDLATHLEQSIAYYKEALRFRTPAIAPVDYAKTQNSLGGTYMSRADLPTADFRSNLQQAIACFKEAVRICGSDVSPIDFAMSHYNLGLAYYGLAHRDPTADMRQAIACYEEALHVYTPETAPLDYAATQNNLGIAYSELSDGDLTENLAKAAASYHEALHFYTAESFPTEYAMVVNNLGRVFLRLPIGDQAANLEQAMFYYQEALRFYSPTANPMDYAMAQHGLGCAYRLYAMLPTSDREANLRQAIGCFGEALRFRTAEASPQEYAGTQSELGVAYSDLPSDRETNLDRAIECFRESLRFCSPIVAPLFYADRQNNLGCTYDERASLATSDRTGYLNRAIACFEEALRAYGPEKRPADCKTTYVNMGDTYFKQRKWKNAADAYERAIAIEETLYQAAASEVAREAELAEARDLFQNDGYCLARLGRFTEAVECLEAGRARALAERLEGSQWTLQGACREDRAAIDQVRHRIRTLEAEARLTGADAPTARRFVELSSGLSKARRELECILNRLRFQSSETAKLNLEGIAHAATHGRPLVYLIATTEGSLAVIVPWRATRLRTQHAVWLDEFSQQSLDRLLIEREPAGKTVGGYVGALVDRQEQSLRAALDHGMPLLQRRLLAPVMKRLKGLGFKQASMIPGGQLTLLPLHALVADSIAVAYAPSARSLRLAMIAARKRAKLRPAFLGIGSPVPNPQPLPFVRAEVERIGSMFKAASRRVLLDQAVTPSKALRELRNATHVHFACHGTFNVYQPLESGVSLSNDEVLTMRMLLGTDLNLCSLRLVVLSACETGRTDVSRVPDESMGLAAGFLQAGAPGVLSALWSVDDLATAVLLTMFYRLHLRMHLDPATALCRAQRRLRRSTAKRMELVDWYERRYEASHRSDPDAFAWMTYYRTNPHVKPFEHPYFWAGFIYTGA
jgi:CHAT domain-containing protein/tetratricopeptide (TPR) repeat protein